MTMATFSRRRAKSAGSPSSARSTRASNGSWRSRRQRDAAVGMAASELAAASEGHPGAWHVRHASCRRPYAAPVSAPTPPAPGTRSRWSCRCRAASASPISTGTSTAATTGGPIVLVHGLSRTALVLAAGRATPRRPAPRRGAGPARARRLRRAARGLRPRVASRSTCSRSLAGKGWGEAVGGPPVVVGGHGLGAMVAVEMARLEPGRWRRSCSWTGAGRRSARRRGCRPRAASRRWPTPRRSWPAMETPGSPTDASSTRLRWDADQERAARARSSSGMPGTWRRRAGRRSCAGSSRRSTPTSPLEALGRWHEPGDVLVAGAGTADDEERRERLLALEDVQRAGRRPGSTRARPPSRWRRARAHALPARRGRGRDRRAGSRCSWPERCWRYHVTPSWDLSYPPRPRRSSSCSCWRGPKMLPRIGEALGRTVKTAREEVCSAMKDDPGIPDVPGGSRRARPRAQP